MCVFPRIIVSKELFKSTFRTHVTYSGKLFAANDSTCGSDDIDMIGMTVWHGDMEDLTV